MTRLTISTAAAALAVPMLAAAMLASTPARATPVSYGTGLSNPALTIDFSGLQENAAVDGAYSAQGVTFGGVYVNSSQGNTLPPTTAPAAANFLGQTTNAVFTIAFSMAVSEAAFFLYTDGFGATVASSLAGAPVESLSVGQYRTDGQDFFGFTNSAFDLITISVNNTGNALIDDVQVGAAAPVPEPSSAVMVVGLAGLMAFRARRRRI